MTKGTKTVPCDHCSGTGHVKLVAGDTQTQRMVFSGTCLGMGHVETDIPHMVVVAEECSGYVRPDGIHISLGVMTNNEAFIYVCAARYAINRQTYAGGIVIQELQRVIPRLPYTDRKLLEKEVADALFRNAVDPVHREAWEKVVDALRLTEDA